MRNDSHFVQTIVEKEAHIAFDTLKFSFSLHIQVKSMYPPH